MNNRAKSILVLTLICLIVTALLAFVNLVTAPVIEESNAQKVQNSLRSALPAADGFVALDLTGDMPTTVTGVYQAENGSGYAVTLKTKSQYSSDKMGLTVGIGADGKIAGIVLTSYYESKDFGKESYPKTYLDADADTYASVSLVSGVTYSSTAFRNAVGDAFTAYQIIKEAAQ
ncbi:MAG: FMN-binding protein [Clostridia bacterium]|nr:FMN-binding protein [Clostridia bacterium]